MSITTSLKRGLYRALRLGMRISRSMYGVAGIMFFILTTGVAAAVPLAELIDDKARESAGSTMPDHGRFDILINAGAPEDAVLISA